MTPPYLRALTGTLLAMPIVAVVLAHDSVGLAQTTSITSSGLNTRVANPITNPNITGGTRPGGAAGTNLFHSFGEFNIGTNNVATFLNSASVDLAGNQLTGGLPTSNIFGRVTGGNPSNIFGTIQTTSFGPETFGTANLYLINPNGILFGPTASINVGGSFTATTADYLKMTDGATFYANPSQPMVLSIAPVGAFGFLSGNPAATAIQGSTLSVPAGQSLSLVGGDITMVRGVLSAPSGRINLASVGPVSGTQGEVVQGGTVNAPTLTATGFNSLGRIGLTNNASVGVTSGTSGGGGIVVRGGQLVIENFSFLSNLSDGATQPGKIMIDVGSLQLSTSGEIVTSTLTGDAGSIDITVESLTLEKGGRISSYALNPGRGGDLTVTASKFVSISSQGTSFTGLQSQANSGDGGHITISTPSLNMIGNKTVDNNAFAGAGIGSSTSGQGNAGNIVVKGNDLILEQRGTIFSATFGTGNAGNVILEAENIKLSDEATLGSFSFGSGGSASSGRIDMTATEALTMQNAHVFTNYLPQGATSGQAGDIVIKAKNMNMMDGAFLASDTSGTGNGGAIHLQIAENLTMRNLSRITSLERAPSKTATGNAGDIVVEAQNVSLETDSHMSSSTSGAGGGGSIKIIATEAVTIAGTERSGSAGLRNIGPLSGLYVRSEGNEETGAGDAGNIEVQARTVMLGKGSTFDSSTLGPGAGGTVTINAAESITLNQGAEIQASTLGAGNAGSITINSGSVFMSDGSAVIATTTGSGKAGNIIVSSGTTSMSPDSQISSSTTGTGSGGSIDLKSTAFSGMLVTGGTVLAQSATSSAAGEISLNSTSDLLLAGTTISVRNTGTGDAGPINVTSGNNLTIRNSLISTESEAASGGNIKLTSPNLVRIVDSTITSSVLGEAGSNGGNINIDPQVVVIQNSNLLAKASDGAGGNINISALGAVLVDFNSNLDASAGPAGISGSVNISSPIQVLSGVLVPMKLAYTQTGLSGDRCVADPKGQFSSFVQTGRDGAPQSPGGLASSPLGFLDTFQTSALDTDRTITQAARLGLSDISGGSATDVRFFSDCRS
jgi:filamentous hemagglutinin family protein